VPLYKDTPYCVLLGNSDRESEEHARHGFEGLMETAMDRTAGSRQAVVAESLIKPGVLADRKAVPLAQASEGLNVKHDISMPVSRIPQFVAETDPLLKFQAYDFVNFGRLATTIALQHKPHGTDGAAFA